MIIVTFLFYFFIDLATILLFRSATEVCIQISPLYLSTFRVWRTLQRPINFVNIIVIRVPSQAFTLSHQASDTVIYDMLSYLSVIAATYVAESTSFPQYLTILSLIGMWFVIWSWLQVCTSSCTESQMTVVVTTNYLLPHVQNSGSGSRTPVHQMYRLL